MVVDAEMQRLTSNINILPSQTQNQGRLRGCLYQPCHQRLREYRFCVNIGRGVNIRSDKCFYIML